MVNSKLVWGTPHQFPLAFLPHSQRSMHRVRKSHCGRRTRVRRFAHSAMVLGGMLAILITVLTLQGLYCDVEELGSPWHYECKAGLCKKALITPKVQSPLSLEVCQLFCGESGALWPRPTGYLSLGNFVAHLNPAKVELSGVNPRSKVGGLLQTNVDLLKTNVARLGGGHARSGGMGLEIYVTGIKNANDDRMTLETKENYTMKIYQSEGHSINATIAAESYFGARHGLETLAQLIVYNDLRDEIQVVRDAYIADGPVYPYRGILLDTSRNFIDKSSILRTIEAMGMSKLNTFHWHITDSHSFPYVSRTWPNMSRYGAYAPRKVYTEEDVREIVEFGLVNGVRVLPEFDAPAHVGEGWQWVGDNATVCFGKEPWQSYCVEPPCGQLNPGSERVYEILEGIYKDMVRDFQPDIFHMGGDEVNVNCWNSSDVVKDFMVGRGWNLTESSFYELWNLFQRRAHDRLTVANGGKELPVVVWTSGLTSEENIHYLDPKKYIVQIWTTRNDPTIARLVKNNFKMIFSNYDALYFDCGFGAWVGKGNNWCSPYKGWQTVYDNSPLDIIKEHGFTDSKKHLILGAEATLWSEQVDSTSVDSRLWPRSAAMAETLWAEPKSTWIHAEQRMLRHRERLVQRGILADSLEPEWCLQNQGHCYL